MTTRFRRILVPHDFSESADTALELAADLAASQGGRLAVLHVAEPFHPPPEVIAWLRQVQEIGPQLKRLEEMVAARIGRRRVPVECRVVVGHPIDTILEAAKDVDLIVMATQGRTGLPHLLIGSVAERVVRHATKPVLTVRAGRRGAGRVPRRSGRAAA
jgi:nucleotide-binding universal stress UspA family protein